MEVNRGRVSGPAGSRDLLACGDMRARPQSRRNRGKMRIARRHAVAMVDLDNEPVSPLLEDGCDSAVAAGENRARRAGVEIKSVME